jgi:hypothetical protein
MPPAFASFEQFCTSRRRDWCKHSLSWADSSTWAKDCKPCKPPSGLACGARTQSGRRIHDPSALQWVSAYSITSWASSRSLAPIPPPDRKKVFSDLIFSQPLYFSSGTPLSTKTSVACPRAAIKRSTEVSASSSWQRWCRRQAQYVSNHWLGVSAIRIWASSLCLRLSHCLQLACCGRSMKLILGGPVNSGGP